MAWQTDTRLASLHKFLNTHYLSISWYDLRPHSFEQITLSSDNHISSEEMTRNTTIAKLHHFMLIPFSIPDEKKETFYVDFVEHVGKKKQHKAGQTMSGAMSKRLERLFLLVELLCRIKYFWAWLAT